MSESLTIKNISDVADAPKIWQQIVDASEDAWIWHTWTARTFNLCAAEKFNVQDLSFLIFENERPVGIVPLVIQKNPEGELEALYYSGILPWPVFLPTETSQKNTWEDFAFVELERRARGAGVKRLTVRYTPPSNRGEEDAHTLRVSEKFGYVREEVLSHVVVVDEGTLLNTRERYQRYHKKYSPMFTLSVAEKEGVTNALEETYMQLHIKDAGRMTRSRESFTKQADVARNGEAFFVVVKDNDTGMIVGMLLVSCYKNAAYDNSVAIDPDFAQRYVGHLLKWRAIEELQKRNIPTYELGQIAREDASVKEKGINHFKEGWSRGNTRVLWVLEKTLDLT